MPTLLPEANLVPAAWHHALPESATPEAVVIDPPADPSARGHSLGSCWRQVVRAPRR